MIARGPLLFVALLLVLSPRSARAEPPLEVAVTIDDMPGSVLPPGYDALRLVHALIDALRRYGVARATAFVVGEHLVADHASRQAMAAWIAAGHDVGNHTYAHSSLHHSEPPAFVDDLLRMEPLLAPLEQGSGQRQRYFRYPFLEEGRSARDRQQLGELLRARGYSAARVTIDFSDWAWGDAYLRCHARADEAALAVLSESYLASAMASLTWSRRAAERVLGRPLVHVLLLHANLATAHNLAALLAAYARAGAVFVPLSEALRDPVYTAEYAGDVSHLLTLLSLRTGRRLPPAPTRPIALLAAACR